MLKIQSLPRDLRAIAQAWVRNTPSTKKDQTAVVRAAGVRAKDAGEAISSILSAVHEISTIKRAGFDGVNVARLTRSLRRANGDNYTPTTERLAYVRTSARLGAKSGKFGRLPSGTPETRLQARRHKAIDHALAPLRFGDHDKLEIKLTRDPAAVCLRVSDETSFDVYGGKFKGRPCHYHRNIVTTPADWCRRVEAKGLAVVDGMPTLDVAPMLAPEGAELFAAVWIAQGRGNAWVEQRGYIARHGAHTFHAATPSEALSGLAKKTKAAQLSVDWEACIKSSALPELAERNAGTFVTLTDARRIGACEYGIKSWCNATGLPYEAGRAPISEVVNAFLREPRSEARAAILHAIRRSKKSAA